MTVVRRVHIAALCLATLVISGCNQEGGVKLVPAGGVVKYKGEPVEGASVSLLFQDKNVAVGTTDKDGKFTLSTNTRAGAPVGHAKISVKKTGASSYASGGGTSMSPKDMMGNFQKKGMADQMKENPNASAQDELPAKYANPDTSGLEVDIPEKGLEDMELSLTD